MFNVVLFEPEIPSNTGNIGRTCVVTGSRLHLIGPLGFSLGDDMLRRAGLGYWHSLDVTTYVGWEEFLAQNGLGETDERLHLLTKKARKTYAQATYADGDFLVFGKESRACRRSCSPARRAGASAFPCCLTRQRSRTPANGRHALGASNPTRRCARMSAATSLTQTTIASARSTSPTPRPSCSTRP